MSQRVVIIIIVQLLFDDGAVRNRCVNTLSINRLVLLSYFFKCMVLEVVLNRAGLCP